jgi:TolA-binding protein
MDELEPLATALRQGLGEPPEAWQEEQRARLRRTLREPPPRRPWLRVAPWAAAGAVLTALALWFAVPRSPASVERWLTAEELHEPFQLDDGSSISLANGGRGRLFADAATVRFDLHQGRANFDVVPGRRRTWTISAGKNEVRVVGTRFSVFYGAAERFEVEVERGLVSVRMPDRKASIELEAGNRLLGGPGRMEVARGSTGERSPVPPPESPPNAAPAKAESGEPATRAAPVASSAADSDWHARYGEGKYAEALALVRSSGVGRRLNELSAGTLAELADAARLGGDPELAARALVLLLRKFPGSAEARDGKFLLGRVHALRGERAAAIAAFEGYLANGSRRYATETVGRLMELYSTNGDAARARRMAERYLELAPNGPYQRLARSLVARQP